MYRARLTTKSLERLLLWSKPREIPGNGRQVATIHSGRFCGASYSSRAILLAPAQGLQTRTAHGRRGGHLSLSHHAQFSSNQPNKDSAGDPFKGTPQDYNLRVGHAIETLRNELPRIFKNGICDTSIYSPTIRLTESTHTNASLQGKPLYLTLAGAVRWSFKAWFKNLELEIQSIRVNDRGGRGLTGLDYNEGGNGSSSGDGPDGPGTVHMSRPMAGTTLLSSNVCQKTNSMVSMKPLAMVEALQVVKSKGSGEGGNSNSEQEEVMSSVPSTSVTVRWKLTGTVRSSIVLTARGPTSPPPTSYSGIFVYEFDDMGFIDEHRIESIMPTPSPEAIQRAIAWWGWLLHRTQPAAAAAVGVEHGRSDR